MAIKLMRHQEWVQKALKKDVERIHFKQCINMSNLTMSRDSLGVCRSMFGCTCHDEYSAEASLKVIDELTKEYQSIAEGLH